MRQKQIELQNQTGKLKFADEIWKEIPGSEGLYYASNYGASNRM